MSRFSVRNSRVGIRGNINSYSGYRVQIEFSDEGQFKVLDLSGTLKPAKGLSITMGQTSIPLFNSYVVSPSQTMFANRTFLGKYYLSTRDIGINTKYNFMMGTVPTKLEFGLYNGNAINDPVWKKNMSVGGRLELGTMEGLRFTAKIYDYPNSDIMHYLFYGADLRYKNDNFKVEAEIMKKESKTSFHKDLLAYYFQGAYHVPMKNKFFDYFLPAARWDAVGEGLEESMFDVNRLTVGLGFGFREKSFTSLIRVDYEWYFVNKSLSIFEKNDHMDSDKLTVELLITF